MTSEDRRKWIDGAAENASLKLVARASMALMLPAVLAGVGLIWSLYGEIRDVDIRQRATAAELQSGVEMSSQRIANLEIGIQKNMTAIDMLTRRALDTDIARSRLEERMESVRERLVEQNALLREIADQMAAIRAAQASQR